MRIVCMPKHTMTVTVASTTRMEMACVMNWKSLDARIRHPAITIRLPRRKMGLARRWTCAGYAEEMAVNAEDARIPTLTTLMKLLS